MYKKLTLSLIVVLTLSLLAISAFAETENSVLTMPWDNNPYSNDWNSWGCYASGSCYNNSYCTNNYCGYSNPWYSACNQAEFVTDVTFPDGTYAAPGSNIYKVWRVKNTGSCTWNTGYKLVFSGGDQLGGPVAVNLPYCVAPGQSVDISVNLRAPMQSGIFYSNWMLQSDNGQRFGVGWCGTTPIWVSVGTYQNSFSNSCTCTGYKQCNCSHYCYGIGCTTNRPGGNNRNPYCNNKIRAINDITIPDGSLMLPDTIFRKTWVMKNGGTCVWDEGYSLVFSGGESMGGAPSVRLPKKVYPGETVQVSIDLKSPSTTGSYKGYYMLQDGLGYTFGYGSYANSPFWVDISVKNASAPAPAPAPKSVPTNLDTAASPEVTMIEGTADTAEPTEAPDANKNICGNQRIEVAPDGTDAYNVTWYCTNQGESTWDSKNYKLVNSGISDRLTLETKEISIPETKPGSEAKITFKVKKSSNAANSTDSLWMEFYIDNNSEKFCEFYFEIPE